MDCLPFIYILNIVFIILYAMFYYLLFNTAFEQIMFICLGVLMLLSGYTVFAELITINSSLDVSSVFDALDSEAMGPIKNILFSNFTVIILFALLILNVISTTNGNPPTHLIMICVALLAILSIKFGKTLSSIPYWLALGTPMLITIVAVIFTIISIHKNGSSEISNPLLMFKILAAINSGLFILFFLWFLTFYKKTVDVASEKIIPINKLLEISTFIVLPFLYVTSLYMMYISQTIL